MPELQQYKISPLGDSAVTVDFGNVASREIHGKVLSLFHIISEAPFPGMIEVAAAYSSVTVYYDPFLLHKNLIPGKTISASVIEQLEQRIAAAVDARAASPACRDIPVCYDEEFGSDLAHIAATKNIAIDELIQLHLSTSYLVYMLGFLPGFAYMGEVDERIRIPRKMNPRPVAAGSVGIAGSQTGIYPLVSPGGWQIVGRTPLKLFDPGAEHFTLLNAGDIVRFYSISRHEFENF